MAATLTNQRLGITLMLVLVYSHSFLAAIGIYGIIAYSSGQRRTELTTRIAVGASGAQIFWLVMKSGQRLALVGIVIGVAGALQRTNFWTRLWGVISTCSVMKDWNPSCS